MGEHLDFGPSRFKCPFGRPSRETAKHCASCRAEWLEQRKRDRMSPQQKSADTRKRRAKLRNVIGAVVAIGRL